ncbi:lipoprotein [Spiroplasma sp. SV19]|uniref:lipoprotein n=1 Tax=Spiroplasma sp. SV19 TaxID=2570468 RepID=UPI0024B86717|nr:lipoprotein [Spiroplasma sp. SV19]WHQ37173.1 hypothetical protein E7Y35_04695 [Spiroplasma sp. SV19]
MKKLLSLLGVFALSTTGAITVVSCSSKADNNNGDGSEEIDDSHKDVEILNKISEKVRESFENLSFKEDIERNNPYMLVAYTRVSDSIKTYQLNDNNQDDLTIKNEFLTTFRAVFDNVNREIKNEYSNYYPNSNPVSFKESDVMINLNFIDIQKLITLSGLPNMDGLQAVAININIKYAVKFKELVSDNEYHASFNMTTDLKKFNLVKGGALSYFNQNIIDFYKDKNQIDITIGDFKTLYDTFNLDYKKDLTTIDNIYKKILTNFIQSNTNLKDMISYNKDKAFLERQTILFDSNNERGFYYNGGNPTVSGASRLDKWIKDNNVAEAKATDFVSWYIKSVVPKLATESKLELGKFKFSLDYINIFGMTLSGYFSNNNTDFISTVILTKEKLEAKITNFANIVVAFLKYYKVNFTGEYHFNVSNNIWNNLVAKYLDNKLTNYSLPVALFKEFTSDQDIINQNFTDLDLVTFKQVTGWSIWEVAYDKNKNLFWFNGGGRDASFVFGSSEFYYMPFYYLWSNHRYVVTKI